MLLDKLLSNLAIRVESFALCQLSAGWRLRLPPPPGVMLHFVLKGRGAVRTPHGNGHPVGVSSLAIVPRGTIHVLDAGGAIANEVQVTAPPAGKPTHRIVAGEADSADLVVACGLIQAKYGPSLDLFDHLKELLVVDLSVYPGAAAIFDAILVEQAKPESGSAAMTSALMTQCMIYLLRRLSEDKAHSPPWLAALSDRRLGRAVDLMLDEPGAMHTLETLADAAAMSRSAFSERFTAVFGRSPMSFLHQIRMQRAAALLMAGQLSIDEVAGEVGYSSRSHFSHAFKKHSGQSPVTFRQSGYAGGDATRQ